MSRSYSTTRSIWRSGCGLTILCGAVKAVVDFGFVREEVAHCYGKRGNESVRAGGYYEDDVLALL